ncbi:MAG: hypothetical protein ABIE42_07275 [Candidatus Eisenbacteria bacterium]
MSEVRCRLTSHVIDPIFWTLLKRYDFTTRLAELRGLQWDDRVVFEDRQRRSLAALLKHAVENVGFYRENAAGVASASIADDPVAALKSFPVLEKSVMERYLVSVDVDPSRRAFASSSGGSTGEPVRFLLDAASDSAGLAAAQVLYDWAGVRRGDRRVLLWGARHDLAARGLALHRMADSVLRNLTVLDAFDLGPRAMRSYARTLQRLKADCIEGYAEALYEFAGFLDREGLSIPRPRAVISGASTLLPHMRTEIERVFGAPVFDRYGSREVAAIAAECDRHTGLHVYGENTFVEVLDGDGREVDAGQEGEVFVTSLVNYTMPLIRYRIGDRAIRGPTLCDCGRPYPLLSGISGRTSACLLRPDGGVVSGSVVTHIIGVECGEGCIRGFQVIQDTLDELLVRIAPVPGMESQAFGQVEPIASRLREAMGCNCRIRFETVGSIEPAPSGKRQYVICRVGGRDS